MDVWSMLSFNSWRNLLYSLPSVRDNEPHCSCHMFTRRLASITQHSIYIAEDVQKADLQRVGILFTLHGILCRVSESLKSDKPTATYFFVPGRKSSFPRFPYLGQIKKGEPLSSLSHLLSWLSSCNRWCWVMCMPCLSPRLRTTQSLTGDIILPSIFP